MLLCQATKVPLFVYLHWPPELIQVVNGTWVRGNSRIVSGRDAVPWAAHRFLSAPMELLRPLVNVDLHQRDDFVQRPPD